MSLLICYLNRVNVQASPHIVIHKDNWQKKKMNENNKSYSFLLFYSIRLGREIVKISSPSLIFPPKISKDKQDGSSSIKPAISSRLRGFHIWIFYLTFQTVYIPYLSKQPKWRKAVHTTFIHRLQMSVEFEQSPAFLSF